MSVAALWIDGTLFWTSGYYRYNYHKTGNKFRVSRIELVKVELVSACLHLRMTAMGPGCVKTLNINAWWRIAASISSQ